MNIDLIDDLLLRWVHIFSGVLLLGGVFFVRLALLPATGELSEDARDSLQEAIRSRWAKVVMITSGLLLLSGLVNAYLIIKRYEFPAGIYHMLLGLKLLLALAIMWISAKLAGRSESAKKFREDAAKWANVNAMLAIILLAIAGWMKVSERVLKTDDGTDNSAVSAVYEVIRSRG